MGEYVGVDWAGKRWVVVKVAEDSIDVGAQPSIQAVWDKYRHADQILIDIPIGLPDNSDLTPRPCDERAREILSGFHYSSVFDVPCRQAVQTSDYETARQQNIEHLGDDSLSPQKWGFAERIHEADVFMRRTKTGNTVRESHPEVCFAGLTPNGQTSTRKTSDSGQEDRLDALSFHDSRLKERFFEERTRIKAKPPWKRRVGVGMLDDIIDAMVLACTARLGSNADFTVLGGETDSKGLPMEIVYYEESE